MISKRKLNKKNERKAPNKRIKLPQQSASSLLLSSSSDDETDETDESDIENNPMMSIFKKFNEATQRIIDMESDLSESDSESDVQNESSILHQERTKLEMVSNTCIDLCNSGIDSSSNEDIFKIITLLSDCSYLNEEAGMLLTCSLGTSTEEQCDRIENLFKIKNAYLKNQIDLEALEEHIFNLYKSKPCFALQIKVSKDKYQPGYTPAKGLCWILSEYQAYHRGKEQPNSEISTWKQYYKEKDLTRILQEAYELMKKQIQDNYSEARRIDDPDVVKGKHEHFIHEWDDQSTREKITKTGVYKKMVFSEKKSDCDSAQQQEDMEVYGTTVHVSADQRHLYGGRWGGQFSFGTIFFSGYGLNDAPPVNYFIDNNTLGKTRNDEYWRREGYARLNLVLPISKDYTRQEENCFFSINDMIRAMSHNNNVYFSNSHFQPMELPKELRSHGCWIDCGKLIVKQTVDILLSFQFEVVVSRKTIKNVLRRN